jgi:hypothetical protein
MRERTHSLITELFVQEWSRLLERRVVYAAIPRITSGLTFQFITLLQNKLTVNKVSVNETRKCLNGLMDTTKNGWNTLFIICINK